MAPSDRSYRALLAVPSLLRILVALYLGRVAVGMLEISVVLFALDEFDSPSVAGAAAFLGAFPGLLAAPVVGALLDRLGRIRLICLDYLTVAAALLTISVLSLSDSLSVALFLSIVACFGITQMFSEAGLRSLLPTMVPAELWERVNGLDASSYLIAWILGPPVAAVLVGSVGGEAAFLTVAVLSVLAWSALARVPEPAPATPEPGGIARQAVEGLRYVARNPTLRGLGLSVCVTNISFGIVTILVPVVVVQRLGAPHAVVGLAFTLSGLAGAASALLAGRTDTRGREWSMLVAAMSGIALAALLLFPGSQVTAVAPGVAWVLAAMAVMGLSHGVWDIAIFTVRQRRTDPRLMGRAFAISMALNWSGVPVGAAIGGTLADRSAGAAAVLAVAVAAAGAVLAAVLVPRHDRAPEVKHEQLPPVP